MWARSEATDPGSAWLEWNHGGPDVYFFLLGKGTNSQRSQAALRDFLYFRNQQWSRWFLKKLHLGSDPCPPSLVVMELWAPAVTVWRCEESCDCWKPGILLLVLDSAWNNTSWKTFGGSSTHSQAVANLCSWTAQRPLDERAHFIDCMLSLQPVRKPNSLCWLQHWIFLRFQTGTDTLLLCFLALFDREWVILLFCPSNAGSVG